MDLSMTPSGRSMIRPRVMDREMTEAANTEVDFSAQIQIRWSSVLIIKSAIKQLLSYGCLSYNATAALFMCILSEHMICVE